MIHSESVFLKDLKGDFSFNKKNKPSNKIYKNINAKVFSASIVLLSDLPYFITRKDDNIFLIMMLIMMIPNDQGSGKVQ